MNLILQINNVSLEFLFSSNALMSYFLKMILLTIILFGNKYSNSHTILKKETD